ncbi:hypothetical protein AXF42_Ash003601 [Apostasia shenzhenica]|uniref:ARM repeat superfamily protein n=1 Tax=Apostasia shenzhenica TaxID=1088818 RepID=A0A2I0BGQ3_9ASPA|nr:hypothetical protein AXF42_Ash003601 [Apostasia shenzhenica]
MKLRRQRTMAGEDVEKQNATRLEILPPARSTSSSGVVDISTIFEPQRDLSDPTPTRSRPLGRVDAGHAYAYAPEKKLTLFALHLAIIEKAASGLGQIGFIWATVVLLGGFASSLRPKDFWFVTAILLVEGARLYCRSRELEWQHRSTRSLPLPDAVSRSRRRVHSFIRAAVGQSSRHLANDPHLIGATAEPKRTWVASDVPLLPFSGWPFVSRNISRLLDLLQILAAASCVSLSVMRLCQQDYGEGDQTNERSALNVFYGLALAEALMFFVEKGYWSFRIGHGKLLERVCEDCQLGPTGMISISRFFYDAYSKCVDGSVFDGLKMDLVSFAVELLDSDSPEEQLIGARILQSFIGNERFAGYTLRKIGSSSTVIERLVEMLNWKDPEEEEIRRAAAEIVSKLSSKKQDALRVSAIPGAMESIASLLYTDSGGTTTRRPYEATPRAVVVDREDYEFSSFNLLGLLIIKRLARDHNNCWKIGHTRGLLARIIDFTSAGPALLRDGKAPESRIKTVRLALQVVLILVSATGSAGMTLRRDISEIVYTVSNVRDLLQYGKYRLKLQNLGVQILTSMAMDEEAAEKIGATGGVLALLLAVFFRPRHTGEENNLCNEAGEALAMLLLENPANCKRLLGEGDKVVGKLVETFADPVLRVNAGRILFCLCGYSNPEESVLLRGSVGAMAPLVVRTVMEEKESEKLLEVSIGLALHILKLIGHERIKVEIGEAEFAGKLAQILRQYEFPESKVPRMRRFVISLAIALMEEEEKYKKMFGDLGMAVALKRAAENTSELECFNVFSGSVGLGPRGAVLSSLVEKALELISRASTHED